jgi:hypothetical protein
VISHRLGVQPTQWNREKQIWVYREEHLLRAAELDACIRDFLDALPSDQSTWDFVAENGYVEISCGLYLHSNVDTDLLAGTLQELARRHLGLRLDMYPFTSD